MLKTNYLHKTQMHADNILLLIKYASVSVIMSAVDPYDVGPW